MENFLYVIFLQPTLPRIARAMSQPAEDMHIDYDGNSNDNELDDQEGKGFLRYSSPFINCYNSRAEANSKLTLGNAGIALRRNPSGSQRHESNGKQGMGGGDSFHNHINESAVAEAMRKIREEEKAKRDAKKRKRDEEEKWLRQVKTRLDEEKSRVEKDLQHLHETNRELYALFNDLQGISHECVSTAF